MSTIWYPNITYQYSDAGELDTSSLCATFDQFEADPDQDPRDQFEKKFLQEWSKSPKRDPQQVLLRLRELVAEQGRERPELLTNPFWQDEAYLLRLIDTMPERISSAITAAKEERARIAEEEAENQAARDKANTTGKPQPMGQGWLEESETEDGLIWYQPMTDNTIKKTICG